LVKKEVLARGGDAAAAGVEGAGHRASPQKA